MESWKLFSGKTKEVGFILAPVEPNGGRLRMTRLTDRGTLSPASFHLSHLQQDAGNPHTTASLKKHGLCHRVTAWHRISPDAASCSQAGLTMPMVIPDTSVAAFIPGAVLPSPSGGLPTNNFNPRFLPDAPQTSTSYCEPVPTSLLCGHSDTVSSPHF